MQFLEVTAYALDGFAFAAETLVGQAVGRKRPETLRRVIRLSLFWGFAGAGLLALIFAVFGPALIDLMTNAPDVRQEARHYLPWLVVAPLIGSAAWTYDGVFIGATLTRTMMRMMVPAVAAYLLALALFLPLFGNHGLWAALMVLNLARSLTLHSRAHEPLAKAGAAAA